MVAFEDKTSKIAERSTERMQFRTKPHVKRAIQRAAALSGVDDSVFTINAAYKAAIEMIATHERTVLQPTDYEVFFDALDNTKPPTEKLRQAANRYHDRYSGR